MTEEQIIYLAMGVFFLFCALTGFINHPSYKGILEPQDNAEIYRVDEFVPNGRITAYVIENPRVTTRYGTLV